MNSSSGDDEAPKDPRTGGEDFTQQFTENDFEGKWEGNTVLECNDKVDDVEACKLIRYEATPKSPKLY